MKKSVLRFPSLSVLFACLFALLCFTSVGHASPEPSNDVHFCLPLNLEDTQVRDSIYAATKHALNLNVGEPRTVRMIYFLPNDRPFRQEVVDSMKVTIRQVQTFYAEQMQAHGYGYKTFRFETDAQGEPLVHRVDGQHPDSHYLDNTNTWPDIREEFDTRANNVYLVVVDNSIDAIGIGGGNVVAGTGGGDRNRGVALVSGGFYWTTVAHEIGHAFGLLHDFRDGNYIMSYGPSVEDQLSACHAEFLSVHPYFNTDRDDEETPLPTIERTSSLGYLAGLNSVPIQLKVSDLDGLHQMLLFVRIREPHSAARSFEVKACLGLSGEKDAIVEFDYDGIIPSDDFTRLWNPDVHPIFVQAVDTEGYVSNEYFELICENCPLTLVKISGDNQQGTPSTELAMPLVVAVRDKNGIVLGGTPVTFTVISGEGKLGERFTVENTTTDANGRVQSMLTLGPNPGTNTIEVTVSGLEPVIFNAVGVGTPLSIAGDYQTWSLPKGAIARLGKGTVDQVAFSSDGQYLAVISSIGIWLYDVATSRELALLGHMEEVESVAFSPDGTILAYGLRDGLIKLWDIATRRNVAALSGHEHGVYSITYAPDGTMFASSGGSTVKLWDISTQTNIATLQGGGAIAFSPDGTMLAGAARGNTVKLWGVATGENIATFSGHKDWISTVAFSLDGTTLVSGSGDGMIKLWDIATRRNVATLSGHTDWVQSVTYSPDGTTLASGSEDGTVKLWDIATQTNIATLQGGGYVAYSPDGTMLAAGGDGAVKLWDMATQTNITVLSGPDYRINSVVYSPDGTTLASGAWGGTVKLWDMATQTNITILSGRKWDSVHSVAYSPDGKILATGSYKEIKLWDVATRRNIATLSGHTDHVTSIAFSLDGTIFASGSGDGTIKLWDVATRRNVATLSGHEHWVYSVAYSPDRKTLASGSGDGRVKLWDVATSRSVVTLGHLDQVYSVAFSPDGTTLASGGNDTVKLWDVATRRNVATLSEPGANSHPVAYSPDGSILASGSYREVKLWDVATKRNVATLSGHVAEVYSIAFSPDGTTLASGAWDGMVLLWDMSSYIKRQTPNSDFNGDGTVNIADFLQFVEQFGLSQGDAGYDARYDLDGDNTIGIGDFLIFVNAFGKEGS